MEVLDPEQNATFRDHYLDVPFDRPRSLHRYRELDGSIPEPLRDRMEIIETPRLHRREKLHIAYKYLIPKQATEHG